MAIVECFEKILMSKFIRSPKRKITPVKNEVIVQHNNLVEARYRLSLQEKRVILWLISQIKPEDEAFKIHTMNVQEFCRLIGVKSNNMYREIEKVTMRLVQRGLSIRNLAEDSLTQVSWLSSAKYSYNEGFVELCFDPHMQPFLINLNEQFTKISLIDIMMLHSIYSIRLYEMLKQYEPVNKREISVLDLREYCGISKEKYKKYNDFKRKVIEIALKEINKKTDITFDFDEIKQSRKIVSILFHIHKNPNYETKQEEQENYKKFKQAEFEFKERNSLIKLIMEYGFSKNSANLISKGLTDYEVKEALKTVDLQIKNGKVRNTKAMLRTALKEKWKTNLFYTPKVKKY